MKRELLQALLGDELLVSMVGKIKHTHQPCIFFNTPLSFNDLPAVSFFEKGGGDAVFADDRCIAKTVKMQIDIWADGGVSDIFDRVDFVMRGLGYSCEGACDVPDANIRHFQAFYGKEIEI